MNTLWHDGNREPFFFDKNILMLHGPVRKLYIPFAFYLAEYAYSVTTCSIKRTTHYVEF
jgi:hypothetical protein